MVGRDGGRGVREEGGSGVMEKGEGGGGRGNDGGKGEGGGRGGRGSEREGGDSAVYSPKTDDERRLPFIVWLPPGRFGTWAAILIHRQSFSFMGACLCTWAVVSACGQSSLYVGGHWSVAWLSIVVSHLCHVVSLSLFTICHVSQCGLFAVCGCHEMGSWHCGGLLMWHRGSLSVKETEWGREVSTYCVW